MVFYRILVSEIKTFRMSLLYYINYFFSSLKADFFLDYLVKNKLNSRAFVIIGD